MMPWYMIIKGYLWAARYDGRFQMSTLIIDFSRGFDHERQRGGTLRLGPIRDDRYLPPLGQAESRRGFDSTQAVALVPLASGSIDQL